MFIRPVRSYFAFAVRCKFSDWALTVGVLLMVWHANAVALSAQLTLLTNAPPGTPLVLTPFTTSNQLLVSVVNATSVDPPSEFMTAWEFRLVIMPDAGTVGSLQFNAGAKPSPYVFDSVINSGAPSGTANGVFTALDTTIPTNVGVQIPTAPGANLQLISFTPSADAIGMFGIYAKDAADTFWVDANSNHVRTFVNIPNSVGLIRIANVFVDPIGDVNRDGKVTVADISALMTALADLSGYQPTNHLSLQQLLDVADLNGDGKVNNADIQALISLVANNIASGIGGGSGSDNSVRTAVPEPTSFALLLIGAVASFAFACASRLRRFTACPTPHFRR
jgi:hypothetical protein